jgi:hypothetical protein
MHQDFDKIIKESLRKALQPIFTKVCGLQVANILVRKWFWDKSCTFTS